MNKDTIQFQNLELLETLTRKKKQWLKANTTYRTKNKPRNFHVDIAEQFDQLCKANNKNNSEMLRTLIDFFNKGE